MICMKWNRCGALRVCAWGGAIPDETTILNFRHLRERHALGEMVRSRINQHLAARGLRLREGTVVDSTLIAAPSSTQHEQKARDPEMHQTRKGKNWYFGMKLHIGVDVVSGLGHSLVTTPAHVHDLTPVPELLHGGACLVGGDAGYQGVPKRPEPQDRDVHWHVALRPGVRRTWDPDSPAARVERAKSSLRAQVEHPFRTVKRHFGYDKVRYRGQHAPQIGRVRPAQGLDHPATPLIPAATADSGPISGPCSRPAA